MDRYIYTHIRDTYGMLEKAKMARSDASFESP